MYGFVEKINKVIKYKEVNSQFAFLYFILLILGLVLLVCSVNLYRNTLIRLTPLLVVSIATSIPFYFVTRQNYFASIKYKSKYIATAFLFIQTYLSFGAAAIFALLHINQSLASEIRTEFSAPIIEHSSMPGPKGDRERRAALFTIQIDGFTKEIVSDFVHFQNIESYDSISGSLRQGYFGYRVVEDIEIERTGKLPHHSSGSQ